MKKNNTPPVKQIMLIVIFLMLIVFGTQQISKYIAEHPAASNVYSSLYNEFIGFLENIFGMRGPNTSSGRSTQDNMLNQNKLMSKASAQTSGNVSANMLKTSSNTKAPQGTQPLAAGQELNAPQEATNAENNPGNLLELNADQQITNSVESNQELNAENNSDNNAENDSGSNAGGNSETNADQGSGNPNAGNNPGDNSGGNPDNGSGGNSGNGPTNINQNTLPTLNPIPSDAAVSQNIAQQNQQADALATELASRQALIAPVVEQAQASKYQSPVYNGIPTPTITPPSADTEAKVQSKQYSFH